MYLYSFSHYAGIDKVFFIPEWKNNAKTWDLLQKGSDFFLVLGEEISFPELYTTLYTWDINFQNTYPKLFSQASMRLIHRMVYERYSTYKKVIPLFLDEDIEKFLTKAIKSNKKNQKAEYHIGKLTIQQEWNWQILIIFPDLWTLQNYKDSQKPALYVSSLDTQNKKNSNRRKIKSWTEKIIISTGSEIFQDYQNLEHIYLIEPQKRYYASQQDPRYKVVKVAEKLAELHWAELHLIESENLK